MNLKNLLNIFCIAFLAIGFTACQDNERRSTESEHIMETEEQTRMAEEENMQRERLEWEQNSIAAVIQEDEDLRDFSTQLDSAQLSGTFRQHEGPYTIFAPSNDAFGDISEEERTRMMSSDNREENRAGLQYLMVDQQLTAQELKEEIRNSGEEYTLTTLQGEEITARLDGEDIVLSDASGNTATVIESNTDVSNGVIHVIDGLLRPQDLSSNAAAAWNRTNDQNLNNNRNTTNSMNRTGNRNEGSGS